MAWYEDDTLWAALAHRFRGPAALGRAERETDGFVELAGVVPGTRVVDLGAGPGRHALALARRGYAVTAVDRSPAYLNHLTQAARAAATAIEVVRRDLRDFSRADRFDAALLFDVVGQLESEEDELRMLRNACRSLVPGASAVVVTMGVEVAARRHTRRDWQWSRPGVLLLEDRRRSSDHGRHDVQITEIAGDVTRQFTMTQRVYSASALRRVLIAAGFSSCRVFGDLDGRRYDDHATRLVAVAER